MKENNSSIKKNLRETQRGISMISLVIAVTLILIIAGILLYNARNYTQIAKLENLHNDIQLLEEQIEIFYSKHGSLPTLNATYNNMNDILQDKKNPNDAGNYYVINLDVLGSIRLNYGKDFSEVKQKADNASEYGEYTDVYVVNEISHTVYYVKGVKVEGKIYYRDNKQYSEVDPVVGTKLVDMFIAGESCNVVDCKDENHLHIGDYVKYTSNSPQKQVTVGTDKTGFKVDKVDNVKTDQTYIVDEETTWRVLGLSEDRQHVLLTSGSPLKNDGENPYLVLQGAEAYCYLQTTLDEICSIYHNSVLADETRSIRIEDINHALGIVVDEANKKVYRKNDPSQTNIDAYQAFGKTYQYKIGDYAPENYLGIGEKTSKDVIPGETDKIVYGYKLADTGIDVNSKIYEVLFEGTEDGEDTKAYWLASPSVNPLSAAFGSGAVYSGFVVNYSMDMFSTYGYYFMAAFGVKPIVTLKNNVTNISVPKRTDISEEPKWEPSWSGGMQQSVYDGEKGKITK